MERALGLPFINHSTALQCKEIVGERRWEARFSFSLVRNPYLRLASMYAYRSAPSLQKGSSGQFCKWLEDIAKKNRSGNAGAKISPQIFGWQIKTEKLSLTSGINLKRFIQSNTTLNKGWVFH